MQNLSLIQTLGQKLSPQQIQFIKLLQVPTVELEARIKEEMEINPALEEGKEEQVDEQTEEVEEASEELDIDDYLNEDDYAGYKMQGDGNGQEEEREMPISSGSSLQEQLIMQLGFEKLDERQTQIGIQLIGSIEADGYIRRDLEAIMNDLAFSQNVETTEEELEEILYRIQTFDPPGIAARNLKECLLIQLEKRDDHSEESVLAQKIVSSCFEEFTKKHYDKILKKLGVDDDQLKCAVQLITKLNPKPGGVTDGLVKTQYLMPDFILTNTDGKLDLTLNARNAPELRISRSYADMFQSYHKSDKKDKKLKETVSFVKQKLDSAKWFIDAIRQRQNTLLNTMNAIIKYQYDFFLDGDESKLRPMILKDIAEIISMDISTVSRVANSKSIQTEFGIYPLKYFFSEGIATDSGEDVSSREVKQKLKNHIEAEDKSKPLSDDKLEKLLKADGYNIARRTVAKYREQLNLPVARLRKEL
ncbi:RNA polymerase factor sigma-54 [Reichenbachiella carrageenanivorans]|uniref:RNA polymerase factor sigma-54 n=1 Tax=Reichenbachiella carrageenanivorans TaxID=2979869 RepID=A0ABY6D245_9BACT|nr:RNA polymerase factor sigma-54 [Reichenbachiella carrageenanivorans]UXX80227.1 RNA polymerase factor sigma-54 [Reichenbachiella carrageenanivorans]